MRKTQRLELCKPGWYRAGLILVLGAMILAGLTPFFSTSAFAWTPTGNLATGRSGHTATMLPDGSVLVAGGGNATTDFASCELYNPAFGFWSLNGHLEQARTDHTATLLPTGKVLMAWGITSNGFPSIPCELYDPSVGTSIPTACISRERVGHTATLLADGKVLFVGGEDGNANFPIDELYDPATDTWTALSGSERAFHTATLLSNGKVLVAGGTSTGGVLSTCKLYDPATRTWTSTGNMSSERALHTATLLQNNRVIVTGGYDWRSVAFSDTYNPLTGNWGGWYEYGSLENNAGRFGHTATLLADGELLLTGGVSDYNYASLYSSCLLFYPPWLAGENLATARVGHTATLLQNGKVLVAGGDNGTVAFSSCELFDPTTGSLTVNITPSAATSAGAQWNVDGGAWKNSGETITGLSTGYHKINFKTLPQWACQSQSVYISAGQTTTVGADYYQLAWLTVNISPPDAASQASWGSSAPPYGPFTSSATIAYRAGTCTISFSSVYGYDYPPARTVTLLPGQTTTINVAYTPWPSLKVLLEPADMASQDWILDGHYQIYNGRVVYPGAGTHTVSFTYVSGWIAPATRTVVLSSGQTVVRGIYTRPGSVSIDFTPAEAVTAGAQWQLDGGSWNNSGAILSGLAAGQHTVRFNTVPGWSIPPACSVRVYPEQTSTRTIRYFPRPQGTLSVTINPASAVTAGAQWRVDSGSWQNSGNSIQISPGTHVVTFSLVSGWIKPASRAFYIYSEGARQITSTYAPRRIETSIESSPPSSGNTGSLHTGPSGSETSAAGIVVIRSYPDTTREQSDEEE